MFWNFPATLLLSCWQNMAMSALHHHFNATNNTRLPLTPCRDAGRCHYTPARLPAKTSAGRWKHDIIHVPCVIEGSAIQVVCVNQDSCPQQQPTCPLCRETTAHTSPAFSVPLSPTVETPLWPSVSSTTPAATAHLKLSCFQSCRIRDIDVTAEETLFLLWILECLYLAF